MDEDLSRAVREFLSAFNEDGMIYRGNRIVNGFLTIKPYFPI